MTMRNTDQDWGTLSKLFHWLTALLIFIQIPLGFYAEEIKDSPFRPELFVIHKSLGMIVLILVIDRLLWRIMGTVPEIPNASEMQRRLAQLAHGLLYGLMLLIPISGWVITSAANKPLNFFWLFDIPAITGPDKDLKSLAVDVHVICVFILIAVLVAHIGAALHHHFKRRDSVLKRMWF
jgi:cytochrome b561